MIPNYINDWLRVIESMANDNTYKLAWGRALIECAYNGKYIKEQEYVSIKFKDIARCMLKYYWNQTFFFNLKQGPSVIDGRIPTILKHTNKLIEEYKKVTNSNLPIWFDEIERNKKLRKYLDETIRKITNVLPENVSWRFKIVGKETFDLYDYDRGSSLKEAHFTYDAIELLKEYGTILSKLLNYKWAQLLEKFNYAPKIVTKVSAAAEVKNRRGSLAKYKEELLKQFEDGIAIDFYSGKPLDSKDISVDHVIPWSFMYSDDIWNLVLTSRSNNSSKSNSIPTNEVIEKLKERNKNIVGLLSNKYDLQLRESIANNYIDRYYFECRM